MYTFTVPNPKLLSQPLRTVSPLINPRSPIPALAGVLFEVSPEGLTLTTSDLEQILSVKISEVIADKEFAFVIPRQLINIINKLPESRIIFSFEPEKMQLKIKCDKSKQTHSVLDAGEFVPRLEVRGPAFKLGAECDFKRVSFAVDPNMTDRYIFTGVCLDFQHKKVAATDIHRLAVLDMKIDGELPEGLPPHITVPLKAINFASNMDEPQITVTENQIKFESGDTILISRLLQGEYPNYTKLIPDDNYFNAIVNFNRQEFWEAVERASLVYGGDKDAGVIIQFQNNLMVIIGQTIEGKIVEEVPFVLESGQFEDGFEIIMKSRYLIDAMKYVDSEHITWKIRSRIEPTIIKAKDKDDWICTLVPIMPKN